MNLAEKKKHHRYIGKYQNAKTDQRKSMSNSNGTKIYDADHRYVRKIDFFLLEDAVAHVFDKNIL